MSAQPKLHHYVPQFYLRQWCDAVGQLVVYPLDGRPPFRTNPRNVAAECNLYTPLLGAPAVRDDHEKWFSGWEGLFSNEWPEIFDRGENPRTRKNLARYLATLLIRHPVARETRRISPMSPGWRSSTPSPSRGTHEREAAGDIAPLPAQKLRCQVLNLAARVRNVKSEDRLRAFQ
jgi:hypothetical protein